MNENPDNNLNNTENKPEATVRPANGKMWTTIAFLCVLGGILVFGLIYGLATRNLAGVMSVVGSIALAVLVLLIMITVHELGHYVAGKALGFGILEFSLGFGPAIYSKKMKNGEFFSIRALPIGGYCAFEGEDADSDSPTAFNNRKPWQRIIVLVAGATMNFLLALVIIVLLFSTYGQARLTAFEVAPTTEYSQSIESGDVIVKLNGRGIYLQTDMVKALRGKKEGDVIDAVISRNGESLAIKVTLRADVNAANSIDSDSSSRALGIAQLMEIGEVSADSPFKAGDAIFRERTSEYDNDASDPEGKYLKEKRIYSPEDLAAYLSSFGEGETAKMWIYRGEDYYKLEFAMPTLPEGGLTGDNVMNYLGVKSVAYADRWSSTYVKLGFFQTIGGTFAYAFRVAGTIFSILGELLTGVLGIRSMGGTVTTIVVTSQAIRFGGLSFLLEIAAYIGVNLAVFNLLPVPALDGSRVVFTLIEMIFKKPVPKNIEAVIHAVGIVLLLGFAVLTDVLHLFA
ncbi:MAG: site-2 protease family protein [Clostridia bacterium]|nr:site-2 protease family protein [Clostridia bacterium]